MALLGKILEKRRGLDLPQTCSGAGNEARFAS